MQNIYEIPAVKKLMENSGLTHDQRMVAIDAITSAVVFGIDSMEEISTQLKKELL
jgi:hypothetical protein